MADLCERSDFLLPLPSELLIDIFALATDNPARRVEDVIDIPPFETIEYKKNLQLCDEALKTKLVGFEAT